MKRWFARLRLHDKIVVLTLAVTACALMLATAGLVAVDIWRARAFARDDAERLAAQHGAMDLAVILLAGTVAWGLAHRLQRRVSGPIVRLAAAARAADPVAGGAEGPATAMDDDEVGALLRAFTCLQARLHDLTQRLAEAEATLQQQAIEREDLLEREREASRLKDEFLAAVSHELRTPLNAIVGWVQILATTSPTEQTVAKAIASIRRNARAQTRVIEDLVDVSRIVTGKLRLRFAPVDLREVVDGAVEGIGPVAQASEVALVVETPAEECFVRGDRDRLQQIAVNLLSNAIKFTPHGGRVAIVLRRHQHHCELEVSDDGAGISPAFLPNVFDRFRQADGSTTRDYRGLGLGLAVVKELAELHGAVVSAVSAGVGHGACFSVRVPRLPGLPALPPMGWEAVVDADAIRLPGVRVLAVDDNADALEVLVTALSSRGADVRVASSGETALQEWGREPADLLICDIAMPQMDGFELLERIRQTDSARGRAAQAPAIALTAHASDEYRTRTRAAGFDYHIAKPYEVADLVRTVRSATRPP